MRTQLPCVGKAPLGTAAPRAGAQLQDASDMLGGAQSGDRADVSRCLTRAPKLCHKPWQLRHTDDIALSTPGMWLDILHPSQ